MRILVALASLRCEISFMPLQTAVRRPEIETDLGDIVGRVGCRSVEKPSLVHMCCEIAGAATSMPE